MFNISHSGITLECCPEKFGYTFHFGNSVRKFIGIPKMKLPDGTWISFEEAKCTATEISTYTSKGVRAVFEEFSLPEIFASDFGKLKIYYDVEILSDGFVRTSVYTENEPAERGVQKIVLQALDFGAEKDSGYTVLPRMQGVIIPAKYERNFHYEDFNGFMCERAAYMPLFGQVKDCTGFGKGNGYAMIIDTQYDAEYIFDQTANGDSLLYPVFTEQLGKIGYKRRVLYKFEENIDYTAIAKIYRNYLKAKGKLVTLKEKIAKNPSVEYLIGTPIVHTGIAIHVSEQSDYYDRENPANNDSCDTFAKREEQLEKLKQEGFDRIYLHLDGWGKHGYDNLHPTPFPPHEKAGGTDGMRKLSENCRKLGYKFGIHDQYRDYYYDSENFTLDNAIMEADGSTPYCSIWHGGAHSFLCSALAPEHVRKNYDTFENLGIGIDGAYLDVFSVVHPDECFNPLHPVTREECVNNRRECFEILTSRGIIPSSEEVVDCYVPSLALCHHAPYFTANLGVRSAIDGIPIPFFNLVWHDCIVVPWFALDGSWGIPDEYDPYGLCYINGGTTYINEWGMSEQERKEIDGILALHKKIALHELLRHEIIDGNPYHQRSVFDSDDGEITIEVDFTDANDAKVVVK